MPSEQKTVNLHSIFLVICRKYILTRLERTVIDDDVNEDYVSFDRRTDFLFTVLLSNPVHRIIKEER